MLSLPLRRAIDPNRVRLSHCGGNPQFRGTLQWMGNCFLYSSQHSTSNDDLRTRKKMFAQLLGTPQARKRPTRIPVHERLTMAEHKHPILVLWGLVRLGLWNNQLLREQERFRINDCAIEVGDHDDAAGCRMQQTAMSMRAGKMCSTTAAATEIGKSKRAR